MADAPMPPHRAVTLRALIDGDTRRDVADHLRHLADEIERNQLGARSISGGYSSGHQLSFCAADEPTHDEYFAAVNAYLAVLKTGVDHA